MQRTRKSWGEKFNIFQNDLNEVSFLKLEPWQRCSWHSHEYKYNLFFVISGKLFIRLADGVSEILPGGFFTTVPNEMHEFQTHAEPTEIIEVMYVQYDSGDIKRVSLGGKLEKPTDVKFHCVCENCKNKFTSKNRDALFCDNCIEGEKCR